MANSLTNVDDFLVCFSLMQLPKLLKLLLSHVQMCLLADWYVKALHAI